MCTEAALNNIWIILDQFTCCMGLQKTCFMGHGVIIYICYNIYMLHGVIIYRARQVWMKIKFKARTDIVITEKAFFLIITLINQEVWRLTQFRPALRRDLWEGGGKCLQYLKRVGTEKRTQRHKDFKMGVGASWVKGWVCQRPGHPIFDGTYVMCCL